MKRQTREQQVIELVRQKRVLRSRDLEPHGIPRVYLSRLHKKGILDRVGRGLYVLADASTTRHQTLVEASRRVPHGVVCLLSALQFHELTTQLPTEVWMAIDEKSWLPKVDRPVIRFVRFSGKAQNEGIEEHTVDNVPVKVYNAAKTIADCFKYRNKIGLDVAMEALRDCVRDRKCTMDQLWHYAKICRVANVMRPYLESLA
jgi:predicted transcriptional regulator of viral defense system